MKSEKCRGYKDDLFVICNHCLPVTVCYTFPLPESGFDREKREKGEKKHNLADFLQEKSMGNDKNLKNRSIKYKNALKGSAKL
jgi:hypothetical protein